jgi:hypothetical protein
MSEPKFIRENGVDPSGKTIRHDPLPAEHLLVTLKAPCAICGVAFAAGDVAVAIRARASDSPIGRVVASMPGPVHEVVHFACAPAAKKPN